jgi:murein DD-endopeptidase MepM/ murein hydrolase activator NlpD
VSNLSRKGQSDWFGGYGQAVLIDHGNGIVSIYAHCSELLVKENSQIKAGDKIAISGATGAATGPCLYFEVRKNGRCVDPHKYLEQ